MDPVTGSLEVAAAVVDVATASLETTGAVASAVPVAADVTVEATAVLPSAIETVGVGAESATKPGVSLISANGPKIAEVVDALPEETALDELSAVKVDAPTIKDAFSPFRVMTEEEFAEKFPELAKEDSIVDNITPKNSKGKVIPINADVARELATEESSSVSSEDTASVVDETQETTKAVEPVKSGDMSEGQVIDLKPQSFEEVVKELDLPDEMRAKLPDVMKLLKEYPDLMNDLADIQSMDKEKKDALVKKIHELYQKEKDPKRQSLLWLLLSMILAEIFTVTQETEKIAA